VKRSENDSLDWSMITSCYLYISLVYYLDWNVLHN